MVTVTECDDGPDRLTVSDRGVGMSADVVVDFFLAAGASFGPRPEIFEGAQAAEVSKWMKSGRFGIGAFAGFLVGPTLRVATRALLDDARGISFSARLDCDLVELRWDDELPVGTEVEVSFHLSELPPAPVHLRTLGITPSERFTQGDRVVLRARAAAHRICGRGERRRPAHPRRRRVRPAPGTGSHAWPMAGGPAGTARRGARRLHGDPGLHRTLKVGGARSNLAHNGLEVRTRPSLRAGSTASATSGSRASWPSAWTRRTWRPWTVSTRSG